VTRRALILRYAAFAVLAVVANLATQRLSWRHGGGRRHALRRGAGAGTLVGLVVKYVLDKRWIFFDETRGARAQGRQFFLYSLMGVATTAIFWVTETAFWLIWGTDLARETGAVLGLMVGYVDEVPARPPLRLPRSAEAGMTRCRDGAGRRWPTAG
jgi:putative flippase GtrA